MLSSSDYYPVTPYQKNFVKIGKCQDVVRNHPRTMEAAAEKADGPTTPECSQRQLRPPREAHTLQDSYCHRADSVLDYPQESDSPPRASRDPEKASSYHQHTQYYQNITYRTSSAKTDEDMGEYDEEGVGPKRTALWILVSHPNRRKPPQVLITVIVLPFRSRTPRCPSDGHLHTSDYNSSLIAIPNLILAGTAATQSTFLSPPRPITQIPTPPDLIIPRHQIHKTLYRSQRSHLGPGQYLRTTVCRGHSSLCMGRRGVLVLHGYTG